MYEVINLDTNESHGLYNSLDEARGCVEFDRLRAYSIWQGYVDADGEFYGEGRVENCEIMEEADEFTVRDLLASLPDNAA